MFKISYVRTAFGMWTHPLMLTSSENWLHVMSLCLQKEMSKVELLCLFNHLHQAIIRRAVMSQRKLIAAHLQPSAMPLLLATALCLLAWITDVHIRGSSYVQPITQVVFECRSIANPCRQRRSINLKSSCWVASVSWAGFGDKQALQRVSGSLHSFFMATPLSSWHRFKVFYSFTEKRVWLKNTISWNARLPLYLITTNSYMSRLKIASVVSSTIAENMYWG